MTETTTPTDRSLGTRRHPSPRVALLALASLIALLLTASPAHADSDGVMSNEIRHLSTIYGADDQPVNVGVIVLLDADGNEVEVLCVDINTPIAPGNQVSETPISEVTPPLTPQQWAQIRAILTNAPALMEPGNPYHVAAVQAALWHVSDGFDLKVEPHGGNPDPVNNAQTIELYQTILEQLPTWSAPAFSPNLAITGPMVGNVGSVGPFVATGNDAGLPLTLTVTGATATNGDAEPITEIEIGEPFYLQVDGPGTVEITVQGLVILQPGTLFDAPGRQTVAVVYPAAFVASARTTLQAVAAPEPGPGPQQPTADEPSTGDDPSGGSDEPVGPETVEPSDPGESLPGEALPTSSPAGVSSASAGVHSASGVGATLPRTGSGSTLLLTFLGVTLAVTGLSLRLVGTAAVTERRRG